MIEFAGIRSDERYIIIEHYPSRTIPKRKYSIQSIPGGSMDYVIDEGEDAFSNYTQQYTAFLDAKGPGLPQVARGLAEWLLSSPGYQRLEDSYDPDFYRMAVYAGGEEFLNIFNEYGRGNLSFNCAPKRYYKVGENPIVLTNGGKIYSPSLFRAKPIVKFTGNGDCTITAVSKRGGTQEFKMAGISASSGEVTVDVERHTAKYPDGTNINSKVTKSYESLILDTETTISWNDKISSVTVIPRWWTI